MEDEIPTEFSRNVECANGESANGREYIYVYAQKRDAAPRREVINHVSRLRDTLRMRPGLSERFASFILLLDARGCIHAARFRTLS